jgi:hypothetical protein
MYPDHWQAQQLSVFCRRLVLPEDKREEIKKME